MVIETFFEQIVGVGKLAVYQCFIYPRINFPSFLFIAKPLAFSNSELEVTIVIKFSKFLRSDIQRTMVIILPPPDPNGTCGPPRNETGDRRRAGSEDRRGRTRSPKPATSSMQARESTQKTRAERCNGSRKPPAAASSSTRPSDPPPFNINRSSLRGHYPSISVQHRRTDQFGNPVPPRTELPKPTPPGRERFSLGGQRPPVRTPLDPAVLRAQRTAEEQKAKEEAAKLRSNEEAAKIEAREAREATKTKVKERQCKTKATVGRAKGKVRPAVSTERPAHSVPKQAPRTEASSDDTHEPKQYRFIDLREPGEIKGQWEEAIHGDIWEWWATLVGGDRISVTRWREVTANHERIQSKGHGETEEEFYQREQRHNAEPSRPFYESAKQRRQSDGYRSGGFYDKQSRARPESPYDHEPDFDNYLKPHLESTRGSHGSGNKSSTFINASTDRAGHNTLFYNPAKVSRAISPVSLSEAEKGGVSHIPSNTREKYNRIRYEHDYLQGTSRTRSNSHAPPGLSSHHIGVHITGVTSSSFGKYLFFSVSSSTTQ